MEYSEQQLNQLNIYSLRIIGREVGVRAPTALTKDKLIDEIMQIKSGKKNPYVLTKVGRPMKKSIQTIDYEKHMVASEETTVITREEIKKEFIDTILKELRKTLNKIL